MDQIELIMDTHSETTHPPTKVLIDANDDRLDAQQRQLDRIEGQTKNTDENVDDIKEDMKHLRRRLR